MKTPAAFLGLVGFCAFSLPLLAQNLLTNGGFETGDFTGWTTSGDVAVDSTAGEQSEGTFSAKLSSPGSGPSQAAVLTQTFVTTPGTLYLLDMDFRTVAGFGGEVSFDGGATTSNLSPASQSYEQRRMTFIATGPATTLSIQTGPSNPPSTLLVDNLRVVSASFSRPGKYAGSIRFTSAYPDGGISYTGAIRITARIEPTGRMIVIPHQPVGIAVVAGLIQDDGDVVLNGRSFGLPAFSGGRITFQREFAYTEMGAILAKKEAWTLQRVGR